MRRLLSFLVFGGLVLGPAAPAFAGDVTLDHVTVNEKDATILFPHISVVNTNLTSDEVGRLFSGATDKKDQNALLAKMTASSVSIPQIQVTEKDGSITLHDFVAKNIDAGKVGDLSFSGADGSFEGPHHAAITIKAGALAIQNIDFTAAIAAGSPALSTQTPPRMAHFTWAGFQATGPDQGTPKDAEGGNLWRVSLGSLEGNGSYQGGIPLKSSIIMTDLTIAPPPASKAGTMLQAFGYKQIVLGMTVSGSYDPSKRAYSLDEYQLKGAGVGAVGVKAALDSVGVAVFSAPPKARMAALEQGVLQTLDIQLVNKGLFEKALAWVAAKHGIPADGLRKQWAAAATLLIPVMLKGDPDSLALAQAVTNFINDPKTLDVSITAKGEGVKLADMEAMFGDKTLISHFAIKASAGR